MSTQAEPQAPGQLRSLLRVSHPRQALSFAVVVGLLVALMGRPPLQVVASAAAVLVVQLALGLVNDLVHVDVDRMSGAVGKPVAEGTLLPGNASFAVAVLLLLAVPLSLQNGIQAGLFLLATLPVGYVHDRWLYRTAFSWVGWVVTFALLAHFVTLGAWPTGPDMTGAWPTPSFVVLSAALGMCVHFWTALPDLVVDNQAGVRHLPLRIGRRTGAPRLLAITVVATLAVLATLVWTALTAGIAR